MKDIFCTNCGSKVESDSSYCLKCGHQREKETQVDTQFPIIEPINHLDISKYQHIIESNEFRVFMLSFLLIVIVSSLRYLMTISGDMSKEAAFLYDILDFAIPVVLLFSFFSFTSKFKNIGVLVTKHIITKLELVVLLVGLYFILTYAFSTMLNQLIFIFSNSLLIIGSIVFLFVTIDFVKWLESFSRNFIEFDNKLLKGFYYYGLINCITMIIFYGLQILIVILESYELYTLYLDLRALINFIMFGAIIGGSFSVFYVLYQIKSLFQREFISQQTTISDLINESYVPQSIQSKPQEENRPQKKQQEFTVEEQESEIKITDIKNELSELKDMLDDGLITQEEYDTAREKIIKKLT